MKKWHVLIYILLCSLFFSCSNSMVDNYDYLHKTIYNTTDKNLTIDYSYKAPNNTLEFKSFVTKPGYSYNLSVAYDSSKPVTMSIQSPYDEIYKKYFIILTESAYDQYRNNEDDIQNSYLNSQKLYANYTSIKFDDISTITSDFYVIAVDE